MNGASGNTPAVGCCAHIAGVRRNLGLALTLALLAVVLVSCGGGAATQEPMPTETAAQTPTAVVRPSDCPAPSQPFAIQSQDSFEIGLTLDRPTVVTAEATWNVGPGQLSLILNGPDRPDLANPKAPYDRRDGPSGALVLRYEATSQDIARGSDWRLRVANFAKETAAGCLKVTEQPLFVIYVTLTPASPSFTGVYKVTYSKISDSCGTFPEKFDDTLDVRVERGTVAIHQRWTGDDSAGTIDASGKFTTSGSGLTHLETYEGNFQGGRIEAVNSFVQAGCRVEYSISGERE